MRLSPPYCAILPRSIAFVALVNLFVGHSAQAQSPGAQEPARAASTAERTAPEQRVQKIRIEDAGNRIDEVRVGGETRSITVQPKGGMPSYQVAPTSGERRWNVLDF